MATQRKQAAKKQPKRGGRGAKPTPLSPKAVAAARRAAELLWGQGVVPHRLLQEVHELLLLRCLKEAGGNYAAAADMFGPSRQSVQQYANSPLRDARWKSFQQNRRKGRADAE